MYIVKMVRLLWLHTLYFLAVSADSASNNSEKLVVDLYYEVLCPDSRNFVLYQLAPAWEELKDYLTINYIPYGKAQTYQRGDRDQFVCQHGPVECQGNIWHACAAKYIGSEDRKMEYIKCMITDNNIPYRAAYRCSRDISVDWAAISVCAQGREGVSLHSEAGHLTHGLTPRVTFIPTVVLDGNQRHQRDVRRYFHREVCRASKERNINIEVCARYF